MSRVSEVARKSHKPFGNFIGQPAGAKFFTLSRLRDSHPCHAMIPPLRKKIQTTSLDSGGMGGGAILRARKNIILVLGC